MSSLAETSVKSFYESVKLTLDKTKADGLFKSERVIRVQISAGHTMEELHTALHAFSQAGRELGLI